MRPDRHTAGKPCLKVRQAVNETEGAEPASKEATVWLEQGAWTIVKSTSKWTNVPMAGGTTVGGTVTITRA